VLSNYFYKNPPEPVRAIPYLDSTSLKRVD
jgi:hypothetical protein